MDSANVFWVDCGATIMLRRNLIKQRIIYGHLKAEDRLRIRIKKLNITTLPNVRNIKGYINWK